MKPIIRWAIVEKITERYLFNEKTSAKARSLCRFYNKYSEDGRRFRVAKVEIREVKK
jgi:hypothetical protein